MPMLSAPLSANYDGLGERLVPLSSRLETEHERDATLLGHLLDTVTESIVRFEPSPSLALRFNPFDSSLTPSTPVRYETWIDPPVRAVLAARRPIVVTVSVYAALYLLSPRLLHRKFRGARARRAAQLALGIALLYLYRSARREIEAERRSGSARSKAELPELARTDSVASIHML